MFARTIDLAQHEKHSHKLAVFQRIPLPDADDWRRGMLIWRDLLATLTIRHAAKSLYQTELGQAYCGDSLEFHAVNRGRAVSI